MDTTTPQLIPINISNKYFLNKSNFSLDDANKILNVIDMYSNTVIHKKD